jgi:hypothetical protein
MDDLKVKKVVLDPDFWIRIAHENRFNALKYAEEQCPNGIVLRTALENNLAIYPDGCLHIQYRDKTEAELYMERFDFLMSSASIHTGTQPSKQVEFGCCPECGRYILNWKPVFGGLAPEWWATMREIGVDPATGHSSDCCKKNLKYG